MTEKEYLETKARLKKIFLNCALQKGEFILSSGKKSNYYLDGRLITLSPEGAYLVASLFLYKLAGLEVEAVGGPTLGADPIVGALAALSYLENNPLSTFIVRKEAKGHGTKRQFEGPALHPGARVVVVDDVATTGKAMLEAKQVLDNMQLKTVKALVIVDRLEGAGENLAKAGLELDSIFTIRDFGL